MKIYLATWMLEPAQGDGLTRAGARKRLLSFWHTKDVKSDLPDYVTSGKNKARRKR